MKMTVIPIAIGALGTGIKGLIGTGIGGLGNKRTRGEHPNYTIIKIGQNTEKCLGDLRILTQTPAKDRLLSLVGKNSQRSRITNR